MKGNCGRKENMLEWRDLTKHTMTESFGEHSPFSDDIQPGEKPEFDMLPDFKKFNTKKLSNREGTDAEKPEDKEDELDFGTIDQAFEKLFAKNQPDKKPSLPAKDNEKETTVKQPEQPVSELGARFKSFGETFKKILTTIQEFFMSLGTQSLTFLATLTGWKFINLLIGKANFREEFPNILTQNNINIQEGVLDKDTLDALYVLYEKIRLKRPHDFPPEQLGVELKPLLAGDTSVTKTELFNAVNQILASAIDRTANIDRSTFENQLNEAFTPLQLTVSPSGQDADYNALYQKYLEVKRSRRNFEVKDFMDTVVQHASIASIQPDTNGKKTVSFQKLIEAANGSFGSRIDIAVSTPPRDSKNAEKKPNA